MAVFQEMLRLSMVSNLCLHASTHTRSWYLQHSKDTAMGICMRAVVACQHSAVQGCMQRETCYMHSVRHATGRLPFERPASDDRISMHS